ncbi:MAG: lasso peptide biosynthesis B2 protein [Legionellaceae bacterium]|nr:lasso peptide biosynthesis B2 protein [Legionellaceae bacterium]
MIAVLKRKTQLFFHMRFKLKCLFFINFMLCGIARVLINLLPLKYLAPYFGTLHKNIIFSTIITRPQRNHAIQLRRSIALVAKCTPWDSNCLTQAMVAKFWCSCLKIPYILYIGFTKDADKPSGYASHAWLTAGPVAITGQHSFSSFKVVSSYASKQVLL